MTEFDLSTREGRWKHFGSVDTIIYYLNKKIIDNISA